MTAAADTSTEMEGTSPSVTVLADSVGPDGRRVISFEIVAHRFILAEVNTHAQFSRNSASSRAIPVRRQLERYRNDPAWPVSWAAEKPGMSGGQELTGADLDMAKNLWHRVNVATAREVEGYLYDVKDWYGEETNDDGRPTWQSHVLHKSLLNRLLEPMMWHKMVLTMALPGTNFFRQRNHPAAMPEFRAVARSMADCVEGSDPRVLSPGEWHTPYVSPDEGAEIVAQGYSPWVVSAVRCARTSTGRENEFRSYALDADFFDNVLLGNEVAHASPLEHVATPWPENVYTVSSADVPTLIEHPNRPLRFMTMARVGKFPGWLQLRHLIEADLGIDSYR